MTIKDNEERQSRGMERNSWTISNDSSIWNLRSSHALNKWDFTPLNFLISWAKIFPFEYVNWVKFLSPVAVIVLTDPLFKTWIN